MKPYTMYIQLYSVPIISVHVDFFLSCKHKILDFALQFFYKVAQTLYQRNVAYYSHTIQVIVALRFNRKFTYISHIICLALSPGHSHFFNDAFKKVGVAWGEAIICLPFCIPLLTYISHTIQLLFILHLTENSHSFTHFFHTFRTFFKKFFNECSVLPALSIYILSRYAQNLARLVHIDRYFIIETQLTLYIYETHKQ